MSTTTVSPATELAPFVAGFVVGEGCFTRGPDLFAFSVALGATDGDTCERLHDFFGVGRVVRSPRRKPHYDDECAFVVRSLSDLVGVIVPFMDEHLPPSYKRTQFEAWRDALVDYWSHTAKRRRPCTVDRCERPRRARGLCRRHYYEAYGR